MAIAEQIPHVPSLPDPTGPLLAGMSVLGRSYRERASARSALDVDGILAVRGLTDAREAFLEPSLRKHLPNPSVLKDMDVAAARLAHAVLEAENIVIFGDYDVDGASSSAVLLRWLKALGREARVYIPDRMTEGYGPSVGAFERACVGEVDLIICVDCGILGHEPIEWARDRGIHTVVVDHHQPGETLPDAVATVNPHRQDCSSGLTMLCAAALAFLLCVAAQRTLRERGLFDRQPEPSLKSLLDIVALATVADVVPLTGPSRLLVAKGLEIMGTAPSVGIAKLMGVASVSEPTAGRIGFALGPRINAAGRVGAGSRAERGALGVRLLATDDEEEAQELAAELDALNKERQSIESSCLDEAMQLAEAQVAAGRPAIAVFGQSWHPGVVGIVASRLKERFDLPAVVGGFDGKVIKASGRSMPGLDLGAIISEAKARGLLVGGGGHAMACGLTCDPDDWGEFERFLFQRSQFDPAPLAIDMAIDCGEMDAGKIAGLEKLQPLGQGMPGVKIAVRGAMIKGVRTLKERHRKLSCNGDGVSFDAIWWQVSDDLVELLDGIEGKVVTLIGSPSINEWQGRRKIQLEISDIVIEG